MNHCNLSTQELQCIKYLGCKYESTANYIMYTPEFHNGFICCNYAFINTRTHKVGLKHTTVGICAGDYKIKHPKKRAKDLCLGFLVLSWHGCTMDRKQVRSGYWRFIAINTTKTKQYS